MKFSCRPFTSHFYEMNHSVIECLTLSKPRFFSSILVCTTTCQPKNSFSLVYLIIIIFCIDLIRTMYIITLQAVCKTGLAKVHNSPNVLEMTPPTTRRDFRRSVAVVVLTLFLIQRIMKLTICEESSALL